jgi:hypothetical protein
MIKEKVGLRKTSAEIDESTKIMIKAYIQGAVYCWCKNCKEENGQSRWFAARDLFGGDNYYWNDTPLIGLYSWHEANDSSDPIKMAGRDVGELLKEVLHEDAREFRTKKGYTREYVWTGE